MDLGNFVGYSAIPAVIVLAITTLILQLVRDWRVLLLTLAIQYLAVFFLVLQDWSFSIAATKLIAGWMAASVIGIALTSAPTNGKLERTSQTLSQVEAITSQGMQTPSGRVVSFLASILVWLVVITYAPRLEVIFPDISLTQSAAGLLLVGMGLMQLGFSNRILSTFIGLLTALSGFEILYAPLEASALVAGLLAMVNLGLAMIAAYLLLAAWIEEAK